MEVVNGQLLDLYTLTLGDHTLTVHAVDKAGNESVQAVTFHITTSLDSLVSGVTRLYQQGMIDNKGIYNSLMTKLQKAGRPAVAVNLLNAFINEVQRPEWKAY